MNIDRIVQEIRHGALALGLFAAFVIPTNIAQGAATISGTVTTEAGGAKPLHVTIDQHVCGDELPDEAILADGQGGHAIAR